MTSIATEPIVSATDLEIAALRADLERAREAHRADVAIIGAALIEAAESNDWCSVYDNAVADVNERLTIALPIRSREYNVTVRGYARVPWTYVLTVEVAHGDDLTDAVDAAMGDLSYSDVDVDEYDAEVDDDWQIIDTERA